MKRQELIKLLKELLPGLEITDFNVDFILKSKDISEQSIRDSFATLENLGLTKDKIASLKAEDLAAKKKSQ